MYDALRLRTVRERKPDKVGEEGRVYFFGTPADPLALKEWYATRRYANAEQSGRLVELPFSPSFHKARFYEMKVIHGLFPERTVGVVGASDARMSMRNGKKELNINSVELPIIVMDRLVGDPRLSAEYDTHAGEAYTVMHRIHASEQPRMHREEMKATVAEMDQYVVEKFGPATRDPFKDVSPGLEVGDAVTSALHAARKADPHSYMVQLLEAGIVVAHPEFNFIPDAPGTHDQEPQGRFVELYILDPIRTQHAIESHPQKEELTRWFRRYRIHSSLDAAYTSALSRVEPQLIRDADLQQALSDVLSEAERLATYHFNAHYQFRKEMSDITEQYGNDLTACIERLRALQREYHRNYEYHFSLSLLTAWLHSVPLFHEASAQGRVDNLLSYKTYLALAQRTLFQSGEGAWRATETLLRSLDALKGFSGTDEELNAALQRIASI